MSKEIDPGFLEKFFLQNNRPWPETTRITMSLFVAENPWQFLKLKDDIESHPDFIRWPAEYHVDRFYEWFKNSIDKY